MQQTEATSSSRNWIKLALGFLLLVAGIVCVWLLVVNDTQNDPIPEGRPRTTGTSAPWPTIIAIADREASKIDLDAVIDFSSVRALASGYMLGEPYTDPLTSTLILYLVYRRPNGELFEISMDDVDPERTLNISKSSLSEVDNSSYGIDYRRAFADIQINPRQAVAATWAEAQVEYDKIVDVPTHVSVSVTFNHFQSEWLVDYVVFDAFPMPIKPNAPIPRFPASLMSFGVDDKTGEIRQRAYNFFPRSDPTVQQILPPD